MTTQKIKLGNGLDLYLDEQGSGETVILIPGWAYTADVFARNQPAFSSAYHTISYDPRSHGRSQVTAEGNDYRQHGKDLHELISCLNLSNVTLLGWSLGVYDALSYIEQFGLEKVKALVAVDESPTIIKQSETDWGEGSAEEIQGLTGVVNSDAYLSFFRDYMKEGFGGSAPDLMLDQFAEYASSLTPGQAAGLLTDATTHDFRSLLQDLDSKIPIQYILREDWSEVAKIWLNANMPNTEIQVLGRHLMLVEFAEEFNALVLNFLK